jgi:hypothetical protein
MQTPKKGNFAFYKNRNFGFASIPKKEIFALII